MDVDSRCARCGDRRVGRTDVGAVCRSWLGGATTLSRGPREEAAGTILPFDHLRQLGGDLRELGIGTPDRPHAPPLAHPVKLGDRLIEPLPQILRASAAGPGLKLIWRLGAAAGRGPLEPVPVGGLARRRSLSGSVGEPVKARAEAGVRRREDMVAKGGSPRLTSLVEGLF
jgi:hypothetical protein